MNVSAIGMVWYAPEHYAEVKAMMKDGHRLPATYERWQALAEQGERTLSGQGHKVVRAYLVPESFRQFCLARGLEVDAKARTEFASWVAKEQHG